MTARRARPTATTIDSTERNGRCFGARRPAAHPRIHCARNEKQTMKPPLSPWFGHDSGCKPGVRRSVRPCPGARLLQEGPSSPALPRQKRGGLCPRPWHFVRPLHRDEIGAVIGGMTGAVIGAQVARHDDRVFGAVAGHAIGDSMDERDRACMGHALELGAPVCRWNGAAAATATTSRRAATPATAAAMPPWWSMAGKPREMLACPSGRGEWRFRRS